MVGFPDLQVAVPDGAVRSRIAGPDFIIRNSSDVG